MDYLYTFLIGGGICLVGQVLMDTTKLTTPRILVIFVVLGVILQAVQLYEPLVQLAHQGATLPLTGFGYAMAKGAIEGAKDGLLGVLKGVLKQTSAGILSAVVFGYIIALICNPKSTK